MSTPAEDEAARLKQEQEAQQAAERQRQVVAGTLRDGMAKDQMQAPVRPASPQLADHEARQREVEQRQKILEAAKANNHPQIRLNDAMAAAVKAAPDEQERREAGKQEAAKTQREKDEKAKQDELAKEAGVKADGIRQDNERKAEQTQQQGKQSQPRTLAEARALHATQAAQQAEHGRAAEAGVQRYAERRAALGDERRDVRPLQEMTNFRERQANREAERPPREETEKRQAFVNSGKPKDKDGQER